MTLPVLLELNMLLQKQGKISLPHLHISAFLHVKAITCLKLQVIRLKSRLIFAGEKSRTFLHA